MTDGTNHNPTPKYRIAGSAASQSITERAISIHVAERAVDEEKVVLVLQIFLSRDVRSF